MGRWEDEKMGRSDPIFSVLIFSVLNFLIPVVLRLIRTFLRNSQIF